MHNSSTLKCTERAYKLTSRSRAAVVGIGSVNVKGLAECAAVIKKQFCEFLLFFQSFFIGLFVFVCLFPSTDFESDFAFAFARFFLHFSLNFFSYILLLHNRILFAYYFSFVNCSFGGVFSSSIRLLTTCEKGWRVRGVWGICSHKYPPKDFSSIKSFSCVGSFCVWTKTKKMKEDKYAIHNQPGFSHLSVYTLNINLAKFSFDRDN